MKEGCEDGRVLLRKSLILGDSQKMKILHITPTYYPATYWGGPIFSVYGMNNALARLLGVELKVLTTDSAGPRLSDRLDTSQLDRTLYPDHEVIFSRRIAVASVSLDLSQKLPGLVRWADVVHLTATYSFPTIPTLLMCRVLHKPLVWSLRGAILDDDAWMCLRKKRLKKVWLKLCNTLIFEGQVCLHVTSEQEKEVSLLRLPQADAAIVRNGVEMPSVSPEREWRPGGRLRLLFLGRMAPKKGIENLLDAMKLLKDDPPLTLTLCGSGDETYTASLKEHAKKLSLSEDKAQFSGQVSDSAKTAAFANADVCVVPSFSENFCIVVAEALAHGVPVIVSSGLPQWQEVEKRGCGLWVDNDPGSLVQAIRKIRSLDLPVMGEKGKQWIQEEFAWAVIGQEMLRVYRSLIKPKT